MTERRGHDPFEDLIFDEEFVRGAAVRESEIEEHRARLVHQAFRCADCTRRTRRRQLWVARGAATLGVSAIAACVSSAVFAAAVACGCLV